MLEVLLKAGRFTHRFCEICSLRFLRFSGEVAVKVQGQPLAHSLAHAEPWDRRTTGPPETAGDRRRRTHARHPTFT